MPRPLAALVVPIRSFTHGKARLASVLDDDERRALALDMATRVLAAAGTLAPVVVTSDAEVVEFARGAGADVVADPGSLDGAADAGRAWARSRGAVRVVVAHADVPHAQDLDRFAADGDTPVAVLVPDHHGDGTPVLAVPVDAAFEFAYGPGSFARHCAAAERAGLAVRVERDPRLAFDVDDADDVATLRAAALARRNGTP